MGRLWCPVLSECAMCTVFMLNTFRRLPSWFECKMMGDKSEAIWHYGDGQHKSAASTKCNCYALNHKHCLWRGSNQPKNGCRVDWLRLLPHNLPVHSPPCNVYEPNSDLYYTLKYGIMRISLQPWSALKHLNRPRFSSATKFNQKSALKDSWQWELWLYRNIDYLWIYILHEARDRLDPFFGACLNSDLVHCVVRSPLPCLNTWQDLQQTNKQSDPRMSYVSVVLKFYSSSNLSWLLHVTASFFPSWLVVAKVLHHFRDHNKREICRHLRLESL